MDNPEIPHMPKDMKYPTVESVLTLDGNCFIYSRTLKLGGNSGCAPYKTRGYCEWLS